MNKPTTAQAVKPEKMDWQECQKKGHVAHFNPETGLIEGPEDAPIFFGQPHQGNPHRNTRVDPIANKVIPVAPYIDESQIADMLGDVPVKWLAWDEATGCNVYAREGN